VIGDAQIPKELPNYASTTIAAIYSLWVKLVDNLISDQAFQASLYTERDWLNENLIFAINQFPVDLWSNTSRNWPISGLGESVNMLPLLLEGLLSQRIFVGAGICFTNVNSPNQVFYWWRLVHCRWRFLPCGYRILLEKDPSSGFHAHSESNATDPTINYKRKGLSSSWNRCLLLCRNQLLFWLWYEDTFISL